VTTILTELIPYKNWICQTDWVVGCQNCRSEERFSCQKIESLWSHTYHGDIKKSYLDLGWYYAQLRLCRFYVWHTFRDRPIQEFNRRCSRLWPPHFLPHFLDSNGLLSLAFSLFHGCRSKLTCKEHATKVYSICGLPSYISGATSCWYLANY
jgi:hypothetical protein